MRISEIKSEVEEFRGSPLPHQQTFTTPLRDLPRFVSAMLRHFPLTRGVLTLELVVFEPEELLKVLADREISPDSVPSKYFMHVTISATAEDEIPVLLEAALGDWVNFTFIPEPELFRIYADHDEWITFFALEESNLSLITSALVGEGFEAIPGHMREF